MPELKVAIGIPTYKRHKGLLRLLQSISRQICDFQPVVIVADNEGFDGIGHKIVNEIKEQFPFQITVIPVSERGISHVRNALMHKGFGLLGVDLLAMVDDDEVVDQNWINELVKAQLKSKAQVIGGAIYPQFEHEPPEWTKASRLYFRKVHQEGFIPLIQAAGNILLHSSIYNKNQSIYFDPAYGLSGGEDKEFFLRLKSLGILFYFCPEAKSYEYYGSDRLTKKWALERSNRIGRNDVRIIRGQSPNFVSDIKIMTGLFSGLVVYSLLSAVFFFNDVKRISFQLKVSRQLGKLYGFSRQITEDYK
jgi:succinoglycan biosynthesis protein ExoM